MKHGEAYVELRESNIPNHTHKVKCVTSDKDEILIKDGSGDSTIINSNTGVGISSVANSNIEYQISPMEYNVKSDIAIPHENIPPYREVYMWECVEGDDYYHDDGNNQITQKKSYSISYDMNGHGEVPTGVSTSYDEDTPLPYNPPAPVNVNGYIFNGWMPK
mgnify:CR=1 FL=1